MKKNILPTMLIPIALLFSSATFASDIVSIQSVQSNKVVRAGVGSGTRLAAVSNNTKSWERFNLVKLGGGVVALKSTHNGKYVRAGVGNSSYLAAVSNHVKAWERFKMIDLGNSEFALQSEHSGKYVRAGIGNASYLGAVSPHISSWEKFRINLISTKLNDKVKPLDSKLGKLTPIPSGKLSLNKQKICKDYAITAAKQNQQATQLKCGFWGPRWDSNHQGHYNWCMSGNNIKQAIRDETNARNIDLKSCGKQAKKDDKDKLLAAIGGFVLGAIMANQNNSSYPAHAGQGYSGAHENWCYSRYKSYRASDNTFQPYYGPRRQCISPYN